MPSAAMPVLAMTCRASIGAHPGVAEAPAYSKGMASLAGVAHVMFAMAIAAAGCDTGMAEIRRVPAGIFVTQLTGPGPPIREMIPRSFAGMA